MILIPKSLASLASVAARGEKWAMDCIHLIEMVDPDGKPCFRAEVTDGKRAAIVRGPCDPTPAEEARISGLPEPTATEALIPTKAFVEAMRIMKDADRLAVSLGAAESALGTLTGAFRVPNVQGRFPLIESAMPQKAPKFSMRVNAKLLAELLLAAAQIDNVAEVHFWGDNLFAVSAKNDKEIVFDGLFVHLADKK